VSVFRSQSRGSPAEEALAAALAELGVPCRVETRANLAVIIADASAAARLADGEVRRRALALAREQGFTHLALELS
jgi:hypothetical protein